MKQQGFATVASLVLIIILTMMGFWVANTGKTLQKISRTGVRYDEVYAIADSELNRLIGILQATQSEITVGEGAVIQDGVFTQVWSKGALAKHFDETVMANFSDFYHSGWESAGSDFSTTVSVDSGDIRTTYGKIETRAFVQELTSRTLSNNAGSETIEKNYLLTVQAYAQNPGDEAEQKREIVVLESVYQLSFIR